MPVEWRRRFSSEGDGGSTPAAIVRRARAGNGSHSGVRRDTRAKVADENGLTVGGVSCVLRKLQTQVDDVVALVSRIHPDRVNGAANQHAPRDQERERHGDLGADEEVSQPAATGRSSRASDGGEERGAGAFNRRREPEQNPRDNGDGKDIGKYAEVRGHVEDQRAVFHGHRFSGLGGRDMQQAPRQRQRDASAE